MSTTARLAAAGALGLVREAAHEARTRALVARYALMGRSVAYRLALGRDGALVRPLTRRGAVIECEGHLPPPDEPLWALIVVGP